MRKQISISILFLALSCSWLFGQQSPAVFFSYTNMTQTPVSSVNAKLFAIVREGLQTSTNDGNGGLFYYLSGDTTTPNATNIFSQNTAITGQTGTWFRLDFRSTGATGPVGPVGGALTGSLPNPGVDLSTTTYITGDLPLSNIVQIATSRLLGRNTAGTGDIEVLSDIPTAITIGGAYIYRVGGTDVAVTDGGTGLSAGTSGGILGFTGTTTIASSVALTTNNLILGGGAGFTPTPLGSLGTTTTVLHGNATGPPSFGAVSLTADVSGDLPFSSIAQIANNSILGNFTGSTADIQVLTSITSANLAQILSNETGTGVAVFNDSPAFTTLISTPQITTASGDLTIAPAAGSGVNATLTGSAQFLISGLGGSTATELFKVTTSGSQTLLKSVVDASGSSGIGRAEFRANSRPGVASRIEFDSGGTNIWSVGSGAVSDGFDFEVFSGRAGNTFVFTEAGGFGVNTTSPAAGGLAVNGYVHVGGTTSPGDNNLLVDGTTESTGLITATASLTYPSATASTATVWDSSRKLISSVTTLAELAFVSGVTSSIQTQLGTKVVKPIYGTGNPIALGTVGVDGQSYFNTATGDHWTYWADSVNGWQP